MRRRGKKMAGGKHTVSKNTVRKYRLYPNKEQRIMLTKTAGTVRYCYNWGLSKWDELYKQGEKCDQYLLSRLWTAERPVWSKEVFRGAQTRALLNLGGAFSAFFRGAKKAPYVP